jgi:hypothetical protein
MEALSFLTLVWCLQRFFQEMFWTYNLVVDHLPSIHKDWIWSLVPQKKKKRKYFPIWHVERFSLYFSPKHQIVSTLFTKIYPFPQRYLLIQLLFYFTDSAMPLIYIPTSIIHILFTWTQFYILILCPSSLLIHLVSILIYSHLLKSLD